MTQHGADEHIAVFHDESGDFGHDDWVCLGLLWVPDVLVPTLAADLQSARAGFPGEVHFYRFPRNFAGAYGAGARTARAWFELWRAEWGQRLAFTVLAVNRRHLLYDHPRFGRPDQAYTHFTAVALRAGLAAFARDVPRMELTIWSDARTGNRAGAAAPKDAAAFATSLCQALASPSASASPSTSPHITLDPEHIRCLSGTRTGAAFTAEQELLQLTDVLLGASATAIAPHTTSATKRWFAREMGRLLRAAPTAPRTASQSAHIRLHASYFPGYDGRLAADGPIGIWDE